MRWRRILIVAVAAALCLRAESPAIRSYTAADGLAADKSNCIVPDDRGFVWFCTPEGLSRFDGRRTRGMVSFGVAQGLPHQDVSAFLKTRSGTYLVGTARGLCQFRGEEGNRFTCYPQRQDRGQNYITALVETRSGRILCGTADGLFEVLDGLPLKPQPLPPQPTWDRTIITDIVEDTGGRLWVGTTEGLDIIATDGSVRQMEESDGLPNTWMEKLLLDTSGRVWVATRHGLVLMKPDCPHGRCGIERVYVEHDGLVHAGVKSLAQGPDGAVWIGTAGGISRLRLVNGQALFQNLTRAEGLIDRQINVLAADEFGNMWAGTEGAGVMRIEAGGFTTFGERDGLASDRVWSVFADRHGTPVAVTITSPGSIHAVNILDGGKFRAEVPLVFGPHATWGKGQMILQSQTDEWWAATSEGLCRFAAAKAQDLARRAPLACYASDATVYQVFEDAKGSIWASAQSKTGDRLLRWDPVGKTLSQLSDGPSHSPLLVNVFAGDHQGNVWMGVLKGGELYRYDGRQFTHLAAAEGVPAGTTFALLADHAGRLWVGAAGGLAVIEHPGGPPFHLRTYTARDGLASDDIQCLAEDHAGRIYAGTGRGVDRLDPSTGRIKHFSSADGLARGEMNGAATDGAGNIWFATAQGLSRLTPSAEQPPSTPSILITDLRTGRDHHPVSQAGTALVSGIRLQPSLNQIQIEFVGFSSEPEENLQYKYMLQGGGASWQPSLEHTANFPGLPPGSYRFLVKAVNSEGHESQKAAEVDFIVLPPFWRTWWFEALAVAAFAGLIVAAHRYRLAQAVQLERVRTAIATDLHDDIGASLSQIAILSEVARMEQNGGPAYPNERLERVAALARELADSMSDVVWSIRTSPEGVDALIRRMRDFASDLLGSQAINFELSAPGVDAPDIALSLQARRQLLLIFKECIHNAARHARCSAVVADLQVTGNEVLLCIRDNGCGINAGAAARSQGGNGIPNMRKRAESLGGQVDFSAGPSGGCTVEVRLPLRHATFRKPAL